MNGNGIRRLVLALLTAALPLAASCSMLIVPQMDSRRKAYVPADDGSRLAAHAPIFVLQTYAPEYNRIGAPVASVGALGQEQIDIDTKRPVIYAQEETFTTNRGAYTNLIYRVHFPEVPMPHMGAGRNVGLLVIVTLDPAEHPLFITTAQTCGAHAAVVPTSFLPERAFPAGWTVAVQKADGERLPGLLRVPEPYTKEFRPVVFLRDETHRVMDVAIQNVAEAAWRYDAVPTEMQPMDALLALPLGKVTTSFYYEEGLQRGYVKGSGKFLGVLLEGWWALDMHAGSDKRYADRNETGNVFYTSMKFWNREESDMWPFGQFLAYRGWHV